MNIGILTFHRAINNGALLQAIALKQYMESLGHDVTIIDYWPIAHEKAYSLLYRFSPNRSKLRNILSYLLSLVSYSRSKRRTDKMKRLAIKMLGLSSKVKFRSGEELCNEKYDCVIYGSDQIWWNSRILNYEGFDPVYWGEYLSSAIKKISYAPSMGHIRLNDDEKNKIEVFLKNFSKISTRETHLADIVKSLTDKDVQVTLDPVFLLEKKDWSEKCISLPHRKKYIVYYNLLKSKEADRIASYISKSLKCELLEITGYVHPFKFGSRYYQTADAIEFISLIQDAEFVITSSFHGTAFSVIFEKNFYVVGLGNLSGRVESLLKILGIENRYITRVESVNLDDDINYSLVNEKLMIRRKESIDFLNTI